MILNNLISLAVLTEVKKEKEFTTIPLDGLQDSKGLDIYKVYIVYIYERKKFN